MSIFTLSRMLVESLTDYRTHILAYHNIADDMGDPWSVSPLAFAAHMDCLAAYRCTVLSLDQALANFERGVRCRKCLVLTFDDGYADFLESAAPVLSNHDFPATLFVVPGKVGGLSEWRSPELRRPLLGWDGLREVVRLGFSVGSHGLHHRDLTTLGSDELLEEVEVSKRVLEDKLGVSVKSFSYPWGKYTATESAALKRAGYCCAVRVGSRCGNGPETDRFELGREIMCRNDSVADFARKIVGYRRVLQQWRYLRRSIAKGFSL